MLQMTKCKEAFFKKILPSFNILIKKQLDMIKLSCLFGAKNA